MHSSQLMELVAACHWIGAKGWAPATGGNMSLRLDETFCLLSESGKDKGNLTEKDFIPVNILSGFATDDRKPSAETGLHTLIYRLFPEATAVLHTHSVNATVLSRLERSQAIQLQGYEMQKSLSGQTSHLDTVTIPLFANDQDMTQLAAQIADYASTHTLQYGFLICGHGLTCWGNSVAEARRHLEGLEFLFSCEIQHRLMEAR